MDIDIFDSNRCELGEGPIWDDRLGQVLWVDILARELHCKPYSGGESTTEHLAEAIGTIALREAGGSLLALATGLVLRSSDGQVDRRLALTHDGTHSADLRVRANDGACDPDGRFWIGTMAWDAAPSLGALYQLDPMTFRLHQILSGVTISNGIGWSPDGRKMYYVDTATARIDVLDYDPTTGTATDRRPFVEIPTATGAPDGLTVDAEGGVWVALWGGGAVHRYASDGRQDALVEMPCTQPTSCVFAGNELDRLVITSAWTGLDAPDPSAGMTFIVDVGIRGLPTPRFRG